jgi:hypothetical protein
LKLFPRPHSLKLPIQVTCLCPLDPPVQASVKRSQISGKAGDCRPSKCAGARGAHRIPEWACAGSIRAASPRKQSQHASTAQTQS